MNNPLIGKTIMCNEEGFYTLIDDHWINIPKGSKVKVLFEDGIKLGCRLVDQLTGQVFYMTEEQIEDFIVLSEKDLV